MKVSVDSFGALGANCYMLETEKAAVLIDVGDFTDTVEAFLRENKEKEIMILATHRHFDHVAGIAAAKEFSGAPVAIHSLDACGLLDCSDSLGANFDIIHPTVKPDILFEDGDTLNVGDINIEVMHTPGHTEGSACFIIDDMIFSGDTLFFLSVGRTDFPTGNTQTLLRSLGKLLSLPRDYKVYPGHDRATGIFFEKANNPYYRGSR